MRIDAQHSFNPPAQGPDWYAKILARNKFDGSVYFGDIAVAEPHPFIRRVIVRQPVSHPLVRSVFLADPTPNAITAVEQAGLNIEAPAHSWPFATTAPVALHGFPETTDLPTNVVIKLIGFRLPADPALTATFRRFLRELGPDRLMFSSNWPLAGCTWKETLAAFTQSLGAMPIEVREQLLGGTAMKFYGL